MGPAALLDVGDVDATADGVAVGDGEARTACAEALGDGEASRPGAVLLPPPRNPTPSTATSRTTVVPMASEANLGIVNPLHERPNGPRTWLVELIVTRACSTTTSGTSSGPSPSHRSRRPSTSRS